MDKEISILDLAPISENMPTLNRRNEEVNYPMSDPDEHEFDAEQSGKTLTERIKARNVKEAIGLTSMPIGSVPGAIEKQVINYGDGDQEASDSSGFGKSSPMDLPEDQPPVNIQRKDSGTSEYNVLGNPTNNKDKSEKDFFSWLGFGDESRVVTSRESKMNNELKKLALALNNSGYAAQSNMIRKMAYTGDLHGPVQAPQNTPDDLAAKPEKNTPDTIRPAMRAFLAATKRAINEDDDNLFQGRDFTAFESIERVLLDRYNRGNLSTFPLFKQSFEQQTQGLAQGGSDDDVTELNDFLFRTGNNPGRQSAPFYNDARAAAEGLRHAYDIHNARLERLSLLRSNMIRKMATGDPIFSAMGSFLDAARLAIKEDDDNLFQSTDATTFDVIIRSIKRAYNRGSLSTFPLFRQSFEQQTQDLAHGGSDDDVTELNDFLFGTGTNPGSQSAPYYAGAKDTLEALKSAYDRGYAPVAVTSRANNTKTVGDTNFEIVEGNLDESPFILNPEMVSHIVYDSGAHHVFDSENTRVLTFASLNTIAQARQSRGIVIPLRDYTWKDDIDADQTGPIDDASDEGKLWIKMNGRWLSKAGSAATWMLESFADDHVALRAISSRSKKKDSLDKTAQPIGQSPPAGASRGGGPRGGSGGASANGNVNPFPNYSPQPRQTAANGNIGKIQTELQTGRYYTGNIDDDWGSNTQTAWYNFWVAAHDSFKNNPGYVPASHDPFFTRMRNDASYAESWESSSGPEAALSRLKSTIDQMSESQQASGVRLDPYASVENTQREASVTDDIIRNFFGSRDQEWPDNLSSYSALNNAWESAKDAIGSANLSSHLDSLWSKHGEEPYGMYVFGRYKRSAGGTVRFVDLWMENTAIKNDIKKMIMDMDTAAAANGAGTSISGLSGRTPTNAPTQQQAAARASQNQGAEIQAKVNELITTRTISNLISNQTGNGPGDIYSISSPNTSVDLSGRAFRNDGGGLKKVLLDNSPEPTEYVQAARDLLGNYLLGRFGVYFFSTTNGEYSPIPDRTETLGKIANTCIIAAILNGLGETNLARRLR